MGHFAIVRLCEEDENGPGTSRYFWSGQNLTLGPTKQFTQGLAFRARSSSPLSLYIYSVSPVELRMPPIADRALEYGIYSPTSTSGVPDDGKGETYADDPLEKDSTTVTTSANPSTIIESPKSCSM